MNDKLPYYFKISVYAWIAVAFIGLASLIFKWGHPIEMFNYDYVVDKDLWSAYGDFIGGVLGTIFAFVGVVLMVETFKYQNQATQKNLYQTERQCFHDLFFELLKLYQLQVSEMCGERLVSVVEKGEEKYQVEQYCNKDFFDIEKQKLQAKYRNIKNYEENRKRAINYYMLFYTENHTKLGAYFRTIYRIYDLIDRSKLIESEKKDYLKIIRAQFTESELFFIRYNAMCIYGSKLVPYINKYNILKHLPAFELLEFKDWWQSLSQIERTGMNIFFSVLRNKIQEHLLKAPDKTETTELGNEQERYQPEIRFKENYDVELVIKIDSSKLNRYNEYVGLKNIENKRLQQLLDCYIKETFIYSNFEEFNDANILQTYSDSVQVQGNITIINSGIRNTAKRPLVIKNINFKNN